MTRTNNWKDSEKNHRLIISFVSRLGEAYEKIGKNLEEAETLETIETVRRLRKKARCLSHFHAFHCSEDPRNFPRKKLEDRETVDKIEKLTRHREKAREEQELGKKLEDLGLQRRQASQSR